MGIRVAYGRQEDILSAIQSGAIPKDSIIFTSNEDKSTRIFFYDANGTLKRGDNTEEVDALTQALIEERTARELGEVTLSELIAQLEKRQDSAEKEQLSLSTLIEQMGLRMDDFDIQMSNIAGTTEEMLSGIEEVTRAVNEMDARVQSLEKTGGVSTQTIQRVETLESGVSMLKENKLSRDEVLELDSENMHTLFYSVFNEE